MNKFLAAVTTALVCSGSTAWAHKSADNHTHCSVDGKGVKAEGKTDAERKAACGKIAGSKWDEKNTLKIEADDAAKAPEDGAHK